jgi:hypothetical protein
MPGFEVIERICARRAKLVKPADRGWIRKLPDGRFTRRA